MLHLQAQAHEAHILSPALAPGSLLTGQLKADDGGPKLASITPVSGLLTQMADADVLEMLYWYTRFSSGQPPSVTRVAWL